MTTANRYERKVTLFAQMPDGTIITRKTDHKYTFASVYLNDQGVWGYPSWHENKVNAQKYSAKYTQRFSQIAIIEVSETDPRKVTKTEVIDSAVEAVAEVQSISEVVTEVATKTWDEEIEEKVNEALARIQHLTGVKIEVVGCWVWVSGDTKSVKDVLKAAGFKWGHKKQMWYFAGKKSFNRKHYDIGYIRGKYGSIVVKE